MADPDSSEPASDEKTTDTNDPSAPTDSDDPAGARMMLEPDSIHEGTDEPSIDCPQCGTTVSLVQIIEEGHCPAYLDPEEVEVENDAERTTTDCSAELSLELVWES